MSDRSWHAHTNSRRISFKAGKDVVLLRRAVELDEILHRKERVNAALLAKRWEVSPKAIQRLVARRVCSEVSQSLLDHVVFEVLCQKPDGDAEWRELEPYTLVLAAADWLVVGRDPADEKVKSFYLSRIHDVRRMKKIYVIPRSFDIRKHLGDSIGVSAGGKPFRFRIRFSRDVAPRIAEVRWNPSQQMDHIQGGELELELPAAHMLEAERFVLSYGQHARAISPPELVEPVEKEAASVVLLYRK